MKTTSLHACNAFHFAALRARLALVAFALLLGACASVAPPDAGTRQSLAPSGKLRVGAYEGSPTSLVRDKANGEVKGVTVDLGRAFAARLGVPMELVMFPNVAAAVDAIAKGDVDFTVTNATPARAQRVDFTVAVLNLELGYLVPAGSRIRAIEEADRPGVRIGVTQGSTSQGTLGRTLKNAQVVPAPTVAAAVEMLAQGRIDLYATNKALLSEMADQVAGSRILDGRWGLEHMGIALPKGRERGKPALDAFATDAIRRGLVQQAADRAGLRGMARDF